MRCQEAKGEKSSEFPLFFRRKNTWLLFATVIYKGALEVNFFIRLSTYTHFSPPVTPHYDIASRLSCHNMWKGIQEPSIAGKTTTLQQQSTKGRLHYMGSEEESSIKKLTFFLPVSHKEKGGGGGLQ